MGNRLTRFDIVSNLPVDVVLLILSHLVSPDVENCLLVNQHWNELISNLSPYWRKAAAGILKLSRDTTDQTVSCFATPREYYTAVRRYKSQVSSLRLSLTPGHLEQSQAYLEDMFFTSCLHARDGMIVSIQRRRNVGNFLIVEYSPNNTRSVSHACSIPVCRKDTIAWACTSRGIVYWVTRNGIWRAFDMQKGVDLYQIMTPLIKDGIGVTFSNCKKCSLMIATYWTPIEASSNNRHTTCGVQVVNLGDRMCSPHAVMPWEIFSTKHTHSVFVDHDARFWIRECLIASESGAKVRAGICSSHQVILQCDCCTITQQLECSVNASGDTEYQLTKPECITCQFDMDCNAEEMDIQSVRSISSEAILSADAQLLGMVFNKRLYVWDVQNACGKMSNFELLGSSCLLEKRASTCSVVKLVALGHVLSIIVYQVDTCIMQYCWLQIVTSLTGETLVELKSWCMCQVDPLHKFYFMASEEDDWLNDIQSKAPRVLATTLHNHHGRVHLKTVESMAIIKSPGRRSRHRRKWKGLLTKCKVLL